MDLQLNLYFNSSFCRFQLTIFTILVTDTQRNKQTHKRTDKTTLKSALTNISEDGVFTVWLDEIRFEVPLQEHAREHNDIMTFYGYIIQL